MKKIARCERLIIVYTGNGKGKTTAAVGLGIRAAGHNKQVVMFQFMKGTDTTGEVIISRRIKNFKIFQLGRKTFVNLKNPAPEDIELAKKGLKKIEEYLENTHTDLVILDEINVATHYKLIKVEEVLKLLEKYKDKVTFVLTGRYASSEFIDVADTVTVMCEVKHHYNKGFVSVEGIDW